MKSFFVVFFYTEPIIRTTYKKFIDRKKVNIKNYYALETSGVIVTVVTLYMLLMKNAKEKLKAFILDWCLLFQNSVQSKGIYKYNKY